MFELTFIVVPALNAAETKEANTKEMKMLVQQLEHFREYPNPTKRKCTLGLQ